MLRLMFAEMGTCEVSYDAHRKQDILQQISKCP